MYHFACLSGSLARLRRGLVAPPRRGVVALLVALAVLLGGGASPWLPSAAAAGQVSMDARALLQGHARIGSWMEVSVTLSNSGDAVKGELQLAAGAQGQTRFSVPVDLPPDSRKSYALYVQPVAFGDRLTVTLVSGGQTVTTRTVAFNAHDSGQLLIGVVAERPEPIVSGLRVVTGPTAQPPAIVTMGAGDLPDRAEAWSALDRLVWQDVDATSLRPEQLAALSAWLADGGRLTIVGGTGGPATLSGFPDELLPYRPVAITDVAPTALEGLLGPLPSGATSDLPALGGPAGRGRTLASVGGTVVAADAPFGAGLVTLVGFDPDAGWLARTAASDGLWRRVMPTRATGSGPVLTGDDSMLLNALMTLPSLALPPLGGLLLLLVGYIVLVGPIDYLVLRRLDRREWAWLTIPVLIVVFAVAAYAFGATLRGGDLVVNQVAVVRGGPDSQRGSAQVYVGLFSPVRATYQVSLPDGALVSAATSDTSFGTAGYLDVIQGQPSRVRDLEVGYASLRALRAETSAALPRIQADLRLAGGAVSGTIRNLSGQTLEQAAIVLGSSFQMLDALGPGETREVRFTVGMSSIGDTLSNRLLGQQPFDSSGYASASGRQSVVRHFVLDRLSMDPNIQGSPSGTLPADGPVLLAWGTGPLVDVRIDGQQPKALGEVLYYIPLPLTTQGDVVFTSDLVRSVIVASDAPTFSKMPDMLNFGPGSVTMAYRPLGLSGTLSVTRLLLTMNGGGGSAAAATDIAPVGPAPSEGTGAASPAPARPPDGMPDVDLFDRAAGAWLALPHLEAGTPQSIRDPGRYVDAQTGTVLIRFRDPNQEMVGFQFAVQIEGQVR